MCNICFSNPHNHMCPNAPEPKIHGHCLQCGLELREDYSYYVDNESNLYCSEECAVQNHGIIEAEWEDEDE